MSTKFDAGQLDAAALKRELDLTINQKLNANFTERDTSGAEAARKSLQMVSNDISSFARFLTDNLCLEVLLFWKEVEQYKALFSPEERSALFQKIYELYCIEGAPWQVNFSGNHFTQISEEYKTGGGNYDEEVFDKAQLEVYELMRLELFPRFHEHLAAIANMSETAEVKAESIKDVVSGTNPAATRHFTNFTRAEFCEEALLFWMECNDFALLFTPLDQQTRAQSIFDSYMGPKAKMKVNIADFYINAVKKAIDEKKVSNATFVASQKETLKQLEMDIFPRYEKWAAEQAKAPKLAKATTEKSLIDQSRLGDRAKMREAMEQLIQLPHELDALKECARKMDAEENLEFFIEAGKYQLLFAEKDRLETAQRLWDRYLDPKADRLVTMPDELVNDLKKKIVTNKSSDPQLFAKARKDVLNLMTDNIYPAFMKMKAGEGAQPAAVAPPPKPPSGGGGCCVIS